MPPPEFRLNQEEGALIQRIKQEIAQAAANTEELKDKFNKIKEEKADRAIEEVTRRAEDKETGRDQLALENPIEGFVTEAATLKHQVKVTEVFVKETIKKYKGNRSLMPPLDSTGGKVLRQLVDKIQDPDSEISLMGASYLYRIIYKAINGEITNPLKALTSDELKHLRTVDPILAEKVINSLANAARQTGIDEAEINQFKEEQKEKNPTRTRSINEDREKKLKKLIDEYNKKFNALNDYINSLSSTIEGGIRENIEKEVRVKHQGEGIQEEDLQREIDQGVEKEMREINTVLKKIFAISPRDSGGHQLLKYYQDLEELRSRGLITEEQFTSLQELANDFFSFVLENRPQVEGTLEEKAKILGITIASTEGRETLKALDNTDSLKELLEDKYKKESGEIDFEKFIYDVKLLCDEVLSVTEVRLDEYFDQAFNPMYHGHFYDLLVEEVRKRAIELSRIYREFAEQRVTYSRIGLKVDEAQDIGKGGIQIPDVETYDVPLHSALSGELIPRMIRWLRVYKFVHNGGKIIEEGLGFKMLAEYAEQLNTTDMDQTLYEDPDLSIAHEGYIRALRKTGYSNHRILPPGFGSKSKLDRMDAEEREAYRKLLVKKAKSDPAVLTNEWKQQQLKRKVRFASAMAKLYLGDYWGFLRGVYFPMSLEKQEGRWKFKPTYQSIGAAGAEKMVGLIDPEKIWIRFNIPGFQPYLPYVFQRRNLNAYEGWDHTKVYWFRKEKEDAFAQGASDEYLDFIKVYISLAEYIRLKVIGTIIRGGWRMEAFRKFLHFKEVEGKKYYNFYETVADLMTVGSPALRIFFDNMEFDKIDLATIKDVLGQENLKVGENLKKLIGEEGYRQIARGLDRGKPVPDEVIRDIKKKKYFAKAFKKRCYQEFLFGALFERSPTRVLSFERREYTPRGENLVIEDLWDFLRKKFPGELSDSDLRLKLTPLFIEALEVMEQEKFEATKAGFVEGAKTEDIQQFRKLLGGQALTEADLRTGEAAQLLKNVLEQYKSSLGREEGQRPKLDFLTEEVFLETLPQFFKQLKTSIANPERKEGVNKGEKITLVERFYNWLDLGLDIVEDFGGDDLDLNRFFFQGGGKRMVARYISETYNVSEAYVKNLRHIYEDGAAAIAKTHFSNIDEFTKFVEEKIAPSLVEVKKSIGNISWALWGNEWGVRNIIFLDRLVGCDHAFRMLGLGGAVLSFLRRATGREGSLIQDYYRSSVERPTNSLDANYSEALCRTLINALGVPWGPENIPGSGYKEVGIGRLRLSVPDIQYEYEEREHNILGKKFKTRRPLYDSIKIKIGPFTIPWRVPRLKGESAFKWHGGLVKLSEGHIWQSKIINRVLPIAVLVILTLLIYLGWKASKKKGEK